MKFNPVEKILGKQKRDVSRDRVMEMKISNMSHALKREIYANLTNTTYLDTKDVPIQEIDSYLIKIGQDKWGRLYSNYPTSG